MTDRDFDADEIARQMGGEYGDTVQQQLVDEEQEQRQGNGPNGPNGPNSQLAKRVSEQERQRRADMVIVADEAGRLDFDNHEKRWWIAKIIHGSVLADKFSIPNVETAMLLVEHAHALRISVIQAVTSIAIIDRKMVSYGDLPLALCRRDKPTFAFRKGFDGDIDWSTVKDFEDIPNDYTAWCEATIDGGETWHREEYRVAQARMAGLWGKRTNSGKPTPWITAPLRMLHMRARGPLLRDLCGDVLMGMYGEGELDEVLYSEKREAFVAKPETKRLDELTSRLSTKREQSVENTVKRRRKPTPTDKEQTEASDAQPDTEQQATLIDT
jgi:hypothetical protein